MILSTSKGVTATCQLDPDEYIVLDKNVILQKRPTIFITRHFLEYIVSRFPIARIEVYTLPYTVNPSVYIKIVQNFRYCSYVLEKHTRWFGRGDLPTREENDSNLNDLKLLVYGTLLNIVKNNKRPRVLIIKKWCVQRSIPDELEWSVLQYFGHTEVIVT